MAAPKGNKFGRPRTGSKNKKTLEWETFSKYCLEGGLQRFKEEMDTLEGRDYVESFLKLLEFHKPKLARVGLTDGNGKPLFPIPDNKQKNRLLKLLQAGLSSLAD